MANTATAKSATPNRLTFELAGDGTVVGPTITNAQLLAAMVAGPLKDAFNATYVTDGTSVQSQMRKNLIYGVPGTDSRGCRMFLTPLVTVADTTAQVNQPSVDVDTDATTATKPEINITMSDTTGTLYALVIEHIWSPNQ